MSPFAIACIAMIAAAIIIALAAAVFAGSRVWRLMRRVEALQNHPAVTAARGFEAVPARLQALRSTIEDIKQRCDLIGVDIAALMEASAAFRLQVGRASFATVLLLQTLVPTLRGSMSDR